MQGLKPMSLQTAEARLTTTISRRQERKPSALRFSHGTGCPCSFELMHFSGVIVLVLGSAL